MSSYERINQRVNRAQAQKTKGDIKWNKLGYSEPLPFTPLVGSPREAGLHRAFPDLYENTSIYGGFALKSTFYMVDLVRKFSFEISGAVLTQLS